MGMAKVVQWVCCLEKNRKDRDHYHLAIKLDRNQQWMMSKINAICCAYMVSPRTTQAITTIILVLGCTSQSLIENSRSAQGTQNDTTKVNLAPTWAKKKG